MEATSVTKSQNSAALLSIWHMVFSRFFRNCEKEYLDTKNEGLMEEIYKNLKALRLAINQVEDDNPSATPKKILPRIIKPFQELFEVVPPSRWIDEINSMMKEVKQTKKDLKFVKQIDPKMESFRSEIDPSNNQEQLESVPHLLTVWYWLTTCWSSPTRCENDGKESKDEFVEGVESKYDVITKLLFHKTVSETQRRDVGQLTSKLFDLFKSEPEYWITALDNFTLSMMQVGYGYQCVVEQARSSSVVASPILTIGVFGSLLKLLPKVIPPITNFVKEAAKEIAKATAEAGVAAITEQVVDTVKNATTNIFMANIDVKSDQDMNDDVANLALITGQGMGKFVSETKYPGFIQTS